MIKIYTGTPGSGKSLHAIQRVLAYLSDGKQVIANFPLKHDQLKKKHRNGKFFYVPNEDITIDYLYQFNNLYHGEVGENQTLLIIDEASVKFNCRTSSDKDRLRFCTFFAQHRKFGFEVVLVSQNMRQIDRQIRDLIEIEVIHRKLNNFSFFRLLPFSYFVSVERNVAIKEKNDHNFFRYSQYYGNLYDTFYDFTRVDKFSDNTNIIDYIEKSLLYDSDQDQILINDQKRMKKTRIDPLGWLRGGAPGPPTTPGGKDEDDEDDDEIIGTIFENYEMRKDCDIGNIENIICD